MPRDAPSPDTSAGCVQRAYLYLQRDVDADQRQLMAFDPNEVTRLVGLRPTEAWRRGDPSSHPSGPRRFSSWKYELPEVRTYLTEEVVTPLLDAIEPHAAGIADACRTPGMKAGVTVVIKMSGDRNTVNGDLHVSTAAITYPAQSLQRIFRLGLSIDHDKYVFLPD